MSTLNRATYNMGGGTPPEFRNPNRHRFGEVAVDLGFLHPDELEECIEMQRTSSYPLYFGQICMFQNYLTHDNVMRVLLEQARRLQETSGQNDEIKSEVEPDSKRILIIDHKIRVRFFARLVVDHDVTLARNETEALDAVKSEESFDLIIMETASPGISSFDLARTIRRQGPYRDTPILFVTLLGAGASEIRTQEFGAYSINRICRRWDPECFLDYLRQSA